MLRQIRRMRGKKRTAKICQWEYDQDDDDDDDVRYFIYWCDVLITNKRIFII